MRGGGRISYEHTRARAACPSRTEPGRVRVSGFGFGSKMIIILLRKTEAFFEQEAGANFEANGCDPLQRFGEQAAGATF